MYVSEIDSIMPNDWGIYKMKMNFEVYTIEGINNHRIGYVLASHKIRKPVHYIPFIYRQVPVFILK